MDERNFGIPKDYKTRSDPKWNDHSCVGESKRGSYQPDIYTFAGVLARGSNATKVIDIGCGYAEKLVVLHPEFQILGIDTVKNIRWCQINHKFGRWHAADLEHASTLYDKIDPCGSVVVCADVVEHLVDPTELIKLFEAWSKVASFVLVTTPCRDQLCAKNKKARQGPPNNLCHVREWTISEFRKWLTQEGFSVWCGLASSNSNKPKHYNTVVAVISRNG